MPNPNVQTRNKPTIGIRPADIVDGNDSSGVEANTRQRSTRLAAAIARENIRRNVIASDDASLDMN